MKTRYVQAYWNGKWHKIDRKTNSVVWIRDYKWKYPDYATPDYVLLVIKIKQARMQHARDIENMLWFGDANAYKS